MYSPYSLLRLKNYASVMQPDKSAVLAGYGDAEQNLGGCRIRVEIECPVLGSNQRQPLGMSDPLTAAADQAGEASVSIGEPVIYFPPVHVSIVPGMVPPVKG